MRSFGSYISKYLVSFAAFILILFFLNAVVFGLTFQKIVTEDYGDSSPQSMLEMTAAAATPEQLSDDAVQKLRQNHIWAIYLNADGQCYWSVDLPDNVPESYTIQDVALFSKGYIEDYPVFVWNTDDGLLVLGYPTDSYTKLTSNYYSIAALRRLPLFVVGMLGLDVLCLFLSSLMDGERLLTVQIGTVDAAHQSIRQQKTAVLNGSQNGNGGAELPLRRGIGQLEVQRAELHAADAVYAPIAAHDGDAQQHGGFPGTLQVNAAGPEITLRRPVQRRVHQFPAARDQIGIKFQIPPVVQLQILLPGDIRDTAEVDHGRGNRIAGAEVGVTQVEPASGVV